jgi:glycerol uptake facilitator-like aquaporin
MSNRIASDLLAEFIGTFAFVFIGAGTAAVVGEGVGMPGIVAIAFAHGLAIMAFAFAGRQAATALLDRSLSRLFA